MTFIKKSSFDDPSIRAELKNAALTALEKLCSADPELIIGSLRVNTYLRNNGNLTSKHESLNSSKIYACQTYICLEELHEEGKVERFKVGQTHHYRPVKK